MQADSIVTITQRGSHTVCGPQKRHAHA